MRPRKGLKVLFTSIWTCFDRFSIVFAGSFLGPRVAQSLDFAGGPDPEVAGDREREPPKSAEALRAGFPRLAARFQHERCSKSVAEAWRWPKLKAESWWRAIRNGHSMDRVRVIGLGQGHQRGLQEDGP